MTGRKLSIVLLGIMMILAFSLSACNNKETGQQAQEQTPTTETSGETAAPSGPVDGGDLIIGNIGEASTFNPLYQNDTASSDVIDTIFSTLVISNENLEPTPSLATKWNVSDDGLTWTFELHKGVKFHDGHELTAEDVVFTYTLPHDPDFVSVRKSDFENIESVKALDEYTVEIKLKKVDADFILRVPGSYGILPKHILQDVPVKDLEKHDFSLKNPVGSGPFKFGEWVKGQYVKVVRFDDYFQGKPHLDSITWRLVPDQNALLAQLQAGEINTMNSMPATEYGTWNKMKEEGKIQVASGLALSYVYIGWNLENPLFQDKRVRQALTHALDREAYIDAILNGQGEVAHVPESPLSWAYNPDVPKFEYDVNKAKQLLAEAGWKDTDGDGILDKDGKKFSFELMTNQGNKAREMISQITQQQLKEVGIEVKPRLMEWSAFINDYALKMKYDALILGWSLSDYPDQYDLWHSSQIPNEQSEGFNFVGYNNPALDKLLEENRTIVDREERKKVISQIYKIIAEDQPYTFLYYPIDNHALPVNMKGFTKHPKNFIYKTHEWWLDK